MKIVVVGTGYVGLVSGTCFAEFGYPVTCVDKDTKKIAALKRGVIPIYEPGLDVLVAKHIKNGRLSFTTDVKEVVPDADVVFIAVGTPPKEEDGSADLKYVMGAAEEVASFIEGYTVIVNKSTVPVDTAATMERRLRALFPHKTFDIVSNPEFLREGSAIEDFLKPDRVVVGVTTQEAKEIMERLYQPLMAENVPLLFTTPHTSELIKYASNSFLATKIAFINEIADLCEKTDANVQDVARGIGLDHRIGTAFLNAGPGYGGSCFPKDTRALAITARQMGAPLSIVEQVIDANDVRKEKLAARVLTILKEPRLKTLAVLGITFKPETDDMRESPSLVIIPSLQKAGVHIKAYDPEGMEHGKALFQNVTWCETSLEALKEADGVLILTEWNEFKSLDMKVLKETMKTPLVIDYRNLYQPHFMQKQGMIYHSIGRASLPQKK